MKFARQKELIQWSRRRYGVSVPARLKFGLLDVFIVSGRENVAAIWRNSTWINSKASVCLVIHQVFKTPRQAMEAYYSDDSGINIRPHPGTTVNAKDRIFHLTHKVLNNLLTGPGLKPLTTRFEANLRRQFSNDEIGHEWKEYPDLYLFMRTKIFRAAVESMCGPYLLRLSPTFVDDFWEFDHHILNFFKRFPRFMMPKAFSARENCLQAIRQWHQFANEHREESSSESGDDADTAFGTKQLRARQDYFLKMEHMNADAIASADLGLIWA